MWYISTMWSSDKDYVLLNIQIAYTAVWLQIAQPYFSIVCNCIESSLIDFFVQLLNWQLLRIHQVQQTKWITYNTYTIQKDAKKWKRGGGCLSNTSNSRKNYQDNFNGEDFIIFIKNFLLRFIFFLLRLFFFTLHYTSKLKNIESARKSSCTSAYNHVQCW